MLNLSAKEANLDEQVLKIARSVDEFEGYPFPHAPRIAAVANALAQKRFNFARPFIDSASRSSSRHRRDDDES